jgi:hypothetical protein
MNHFLYIFFRYSIAVGNDHVEPGFPYISDTGTRSPESCVFGQLLNIGAALGKMFFLYIKPMVLTAREQDYVTIRLSLQKNDQMSRSMSYKKKC